MKIRGKNNDKESRQPAYVTGPELYKKIFNKKSASRKGNRDSGGEFNESRPYTMAKAALQELQSANGLNIVPVPGGTSIEKVSMVKQRETNKSNGDKNSPTV